jgi:RNA polymerase sigma-70 factor (ECF subfamily)
MNEPRTDLELVQLFQARPDYPEGRQAERELLLRWRSRVHAWCWRMVGEREQAEDLAQECLVLIHRALPKFEPRAAVTSWIYAIVRNRCLAALRRARPRRAEEEELYLLEEPSPGPEDSFVRREWEERVMSAMRETLSPLEQTALWLKAYEGMPVKDITRLLGVQEESGARALLQTARRKLRAALERGAAGEEGA